MAIKLVSNEKIAETSSRGNQEKWYDKETDSWYKLDQFGYESLAETVIADSVLKNKRSQHTLEKVGFQETGRDDTFVYYIISQSDWLKLGDEQL